MLSPSPLRGEGWDGGDRRGCPHITSRVILPSAPFSTPFEITDLHDLPDLTSLVDKSVVLEYVASK